MKRCGHGWKSALLGTLLLSLIGVNAALQAQERDAEAERRATEAQLEQLQRELEQRQAAQGDRQQRLSNTERQLQRLERDISSVASELNRTREAIKGINTRITDLESQQDELEQQQAQQSDLLERQVDSAYRAGRSDFIKMILNQNDPARVERMLSYYQFLNEARLAEIDALLETQRELAQVKVELTEQREQLAEQEAQQERQQGVLAEQQQEQQQLVAKLNQELQAGNQEIEQLQQNQVDLEEVLAAIMAVLRAEPQLDGLNDDKGQLRWPTEGRVQRLYGTRRNGSVNWKGVLINGESGQPITAVAAGRVIYADWMRGFGLLLVLDHGNGFMSLYGHTQTILPQVGQVIPRGQTVALMGQSGGRSEPALYFELRVKGEAVNPTQWMR